MVETYAAAIAVLGVIGGIATERLLDQYMAWVRSRFSWPAQRALRTAFLIIPFLVLGAAATALTIGLTREAFIAGFLIGFTGAAVVDFLRWRRRNR